MLLIITSKCSMGCYHCMSDCKLDGIDMDFSTFMSAFEFSLTRMKMTPIILSGGEPTENLNFMQMLGYSIGELSKMKKHPLLMILSNGYNLSQHPEILESIDSYNKDWIKIQVVIDDRYYPYHVDEKLLSKFRCIELCHTVNSIYPQGRALQNNIPWTAKASKCFNIRAISKQINFNSLNEVVQKYSIPYLKFCSPNIDMHGNIRLGESLLCPICSNIYKTDKEILHDIKNFRCTGCEIINSKLPPLYRQFVN